MSDDPTAGRPDPDVATAGDVPDATDTGVTTDSTDLARLEAAAEQARLAAAQAADALAAARRAAADPEPVTTDGDLAPTPAPSDRSGTDRRDPAPTKTARTARGTSSAATTSPGRRRRRPRRIVLVAGILVLAGLVFFGVALGTFLSGRADVAASTATARDQALRAAQQDVVVLNSLDYRQVDQSLAAWRDASTGALRDQFNSVDDTAKQALVTAKSVTTAKVVAAAVSAVDAGKGTATVLAGVEVQVTLDGQAPATKRQRFSVSMTRVGSTWKISALQQVGLQLT